MQLNEKKLRKLIVKELMLIKEDLPMPNTTLMDPDQITDPEVLLSELNGITQALSRLYDNQKMMFKRIVSLEENIKNET